ncbi:MAG: TfoX/Sxy family protein [Rhodothermales bacterium]
MAFDTALAERIRSTLASKVSVTEKRMFGGLAFMHRGYMFCGIVKDELMARVGPAGYEAALRLPHVRPMDFTGKPMKGYVYVSRDGLESDAALDGWVDRTLSFVKTLPDKTA